MCLALPVAQAAAHHKGILSSINLGARYSSIMQNRGIVLYDDFQLDPVLAVFLFDDRLEYLGDSIGYRDFIYKDQIRLRSRLVSITDKPLFPKRQALIDSGAHRDDTYEWNTRLEIFFPGYNDNYAFEIDLGYSKDLRAHNGNYFDLSTKIKLFDFRVPKAQTLIEPNLYLSTGIGDSNHNQYFYGPTAQSGLNNLSYGLWFAFPEEADRFYPIIQITHFEVLGTHNKNAAYADGRNKGWLISFIATFGALSILK